MKTIEEIAHTAAWQIFEELGMSKHSVVRMEEIIAERLTEQKKIDIEKGLSFLRIYGEGDFSCMEEFESKFRKVMEE